MDAGNTLLHNSMLVFILGPHYFFLHDSKLGPWVLCATRSVPVYGSLVKGQSITLPEYLPPLPGNPVLGWLTGLSSNAHTIAISNSNIASLEHLLCSLDLCTVSSLNLFPCCKPCSFDKPYMHPFRDFRPGRLDEP